MNIQEFDDGQLWVYRQPGGCIEIGQLNNDNPTDRKQDLIHICDMEIVSKISTALKQLSEKG